MKFSKFGASVAGISLNIGVSLAGLVNMKNTLSIQCHLTWPHDM
jgi:hypothetical protein